MDDDGIERIEFAAPKTVVPYPQVDCWLSLTCRYQATGGWTSIEPEAATMSRTNSSKGRLGSDLIFDPTVESKRSRLLSLALSAITQDQHPLIGEVVGIVIAIKQPID